MFNFFSLSFFPSFIIFSTFQEISVTGTQIATVRTHSNHALQGIQSCENYIKKFRADSRNFVQIYEILWRFTKFCEDLRNFVVVIWILKS